MHIREHIIEEGILTHLEDPWKQVEKHVMLEEKSGIFNQ